MTVKYNEDVPVMLDIYWVFVLTMQSHNMYSKCDDHFG